MELCRRMNYVLSLLLFLIACSSIAVGLYLICGFKQINENILPTFDEGKAKLKIMYETMNIYPGTFIENPPNISHSDPLVDIHMDTVADWFGYGLSALGVALGTLGITSVIGTYRKSKRLQCISIILTIVEVSAEVLGLVFNKVILNMVKDFFLHELYYSFKSIRSHDAASIGWNVVMQKFSCCGVESYLDFNASSSFDETWTQPFHSFLQQNPFSTALACCDRIYIMPRLPRFPGPCRESDYLEKKGCMTVLLDAVNEYKTITIVAVGCVIVIQVGLMILLVVVNGYILKKSMKKQRQIGTETDEK